MTNSQCPSGSCGVPGQATRPNECNGGDLDCAPGEGPNDGQCQSGPLDLFCGPNATFITCNSDADCSSRNVRSCTGGTRANQVCYLSCVGGSNAGKACLNNGSPDCPSGTCTGAPVAPTNCPGGTCDLEKCTISALRECFLDNGVTSTVCEGGTNNGVACSVASQCPSGVCGGVSDKASGQAVVPVNDAADPTLASLSCVFSTATAGSVNNVVGLPGLESVELQMHIQGTP